MNRTLPFLVSIAALAGLAACATAEGYRQQTAMWLGATADQLMLERGAPTQRDRLSDGREMWVYSVREHHRTDGYSTSVPHTRTVRRTGADGRVTEVSETYYETRYEPPRDWWTQCETRFVVGLGGRVEDFRFTGDGCLAPEIH